MNERYSWFKAENCGTLRSVLKWKLISNLNFHFARFPYLLEIFVRSRTLNFCDIYLVLWRGSNSIVSIKNSLYYSEWGLSDLLQLHLTFTNIHCINIHWTNVFYQVGWGCRIHRLLLCKGVIPPPTKVLDMTLNNLMVMFQWWSNFGECEVPLHYHHSQVHSSP